jgi:Protein of unknown function (DUF2889)
MEFLPEAAGPHDPVLVTNARLAGSVRRTTNIDTTRPDGLFADARVDGRARDVRTNPDGTTDVVAEAWVRATVSPQQTLLSIETSPDVPALQQLLGGSVGSGFRSRFNEVLRQAGTHESGTHESDDGSLLYLLLDDLPGATLVSGYVLLRSGALDAPAPAAAPTGPVPAPAAAPTGPAAPAEQPPPQRPAPNMGRMGDLCAGWALDATMMVHVRTTGLIPVPVGPPAPVLEREGDPFSWHAMADLPPFSIRRRRRLDLIAPATAGEAHRIDLHFRDSHVGGDGVETVLHEYTVTGSADTGSGQIVSVAARAQVLPWLECPGAVASAERLAGMELSSLRPTIRHDFVGRSTCTHLNDSLRSLADITALARELEPTPS